MDKEIADFISKRDKMLALNDQKAFDEYAVEQGVKFSSPEVAEIARHKSITGVTNLPKELREASDKWLKDRNFRSWM